jgi:hypothetical protein
MILTWIILTMEQENIKSEIEAYLVDYSICGSSVFGVLLIPFNNDIAQN